eukprot:11205120-Lingulodinium_polyedra.AAC.1
MERPTALWLQDAQQGRVRRGGARPPHGLRRGPGPAGRQERRRVDGRFGLGRVPQRPYEDLSSAFCGQCARSLLWRLRPRGSWFDGGIPSSIVSSRAREDD